MSKLVLQSVGWSEVNCYWDEISQGIVIDLDACLGRHNNFTESNYLCWAGSGTWLDADLRSNEIYTHLQYLLNCVSAVACKSCTSHMKRVTITVIDWYGKHMSRLLIQDLAGWLAWFMDHGSLPRVEVTVRHLSEWHRVHEEQGASALAKGNSSPLAFAEHSRYRTRCSTWRNLASDMMHIVGETNYFSCSSESWMAHVDGFCSRLSHSMSGDRYSCGVSETGSWHAFPVDNSVRRRSASISRGQNQSVSSMSGFGSGISGKDSVFGNGSEADDTSSIFGVVARRGSEEKRFQHAVVSDSNSIFGDCTSAGRGQKHRRADVIDGSDSILGGCARVSNACPSKKPRYDSDSDNTWIKQLQSVNDSDIVVHAIHGAPAPWNGVVATLQERVCDVVCSYHVEERCGQAVKYRAAIHMGGHCEAVVHGDVWQARRTFGTDGWTAQGIKHAIRRAAMAATRMGFTRTVQIWGAVFRCLVNDDFGVVEGLYSCAILQAYAVVLLEPICLLTPEVMCAIAQNKDVRELLRRCAILESATCVLRLFHLAALDSADNYQKLCQVLPLCGMLPKRNRKADDMERTMKFSKDVFASISKEQLCMVNEKAFSGWEPPRPPFADHFDIVMQCRAENVALLPLFPPLSILYPQVSIFKQTTTAVPSLQILDKHHVQVQCAAMDRNVYAQLLVKEIINHRMKRCPSDYLTQDALWKLMRQLGARAKTVLRLDDILHWQLRQSVEGYLGHMLYSMHKMKLEYLNMCMGEQLCLAAGISFRAAFITKDPPSWTFADSIGDKQLVEFDGRFLGLTDRWGYQRELDETGQFIIAKMCFNVSHVWTEDGQEFRGCAKQYLFHKCGPACQFWHPRRRSLGECLLELARKWVRTQETFARRPWSSLSHPEKRELISPWDYSIHQCDADGTPSLKNLSVVQGHAMKMPDCPHFNGRYCSVFSGQECAAVPAHVRARAAKLNRLIWRHWQSMARW